MTIGYDASEIIDAHGEQATPITIAAQCLQLLFGLSCSSLLTNCIFDIPVLGYIWKICGAALCLNILGMTALSVLCCITSCIEVYHNYNFENGEDMGCIGSSESDSEE